MHAININNYRDTAAKLGKHVLLDVRTIQEYRTGHLPGSRNLPLQYIEDMEELTDRKDMPIFVYCHSGVRSAMAAIELEELGYTNVKNLGGIAAYTGEVEI